MSENGKRNSTRERKLPAFLRDKDIEYGINTPLRPQDSKELAQPPQEQAQIAKLLAKFISNINKSDREHQFNEPYDGSVSQLPLSSHPQGSKLSRRNQRRPHSEPIDQPTPTPTAKVNQHRGPNQDYHKGGARGQDRTGSNKVSKNNSYQDTSRFPNQNISNNTKGQLGIGVGEHPGGRGGSERRQGREGSTTGSKAKKPFNPIEIRSYRQKSDLKLFKRQSYHVAIAYHIHLRGKGPSATGQRDIDPTFHSRRLRQQQGIRD